MLDHPTKTVADIIAGVRLSYEGVNYAGHDGARDIVQELWSAGWTIIRRNRRDVFDVDPKIIPSGMVYEWRAKSILGEPTQRALDGMTRGDWQFVPASRHDGIFMPVGYKDVIEVGGQMLMERAREYADKANAERVAKAHKNVDDWYECAATGGFSGGVRIWTGDANKPPPEFRHVGVEPVMADKIIETLPRAAPTAALPGLVSIPDVPRIVRRVPRSSALRWLFNLISKES